MTIQITQAFLESKAEAAAVATAATGRQWSPQQRAVFSFVADRSRKHGVVEALAGTGKTTTILEALSYTREEDSVVLLAFNKAIAEELSQRVPVGVDARTFHSLGLAAITRAQGRRTIDRFALDNRLQSLLGGGRATKEARTVISKLIGLAKGCLLSTYEELADLADRFDIEFPKDFSKERLIGVARQVMRADLQSTQGPINFDDMIWLPVAQDLTLPHYDWVFVDETQDLNPCQLEMAKRVAGEDGRIVAVGDRRQAIYAFRGADAAAIPRMISELSAEVMPLTVTYRCPSAVVREANEIVPALEAAPSAPEGTVRHTSLEKLQAEAEAGDYVISRLNAPLVSLCMQWIASGRRAAIRGRDIGQGLIAWVKATGLNSPRDLRAAIHQWHQQELQRLEELERDTQEADDKAACLSALLDGCASGDEMIGKIERLFSDDAGTNAIQLMSAHRSKGLESPRVWLLRWTFCRDGLEDSAEEERNLLYVGITRSKGELVYVNKLGGLS